jgi:hypothetical protein
MLCRSDQQLPSYDPVPDKEATDGRMLRKVWRAAVSKGVLSHHVDMFDDCSALKWPEVASWAW